MIDQKTKARAAVSRAVKSGALYRPSFCQRCGIDSDVEGHHVDYTKPLEVDWLCTWCYQNRAEGDDIGGRPIKHSSLKEAAFRNVWSKNRMADVVPFREYCILVTQRCSLCGCEPQECTPYKRKDGTYTVRWQYLQHDLNNTLQPVCRTCRFLLTHNDLTRILKTCARIMARKMHGKIDNWLSTFRAVG